MSIVSSILITKLADFGVKLAISLGWKFNDGPFHRHAEKRRRAIELRELKAKDKMKSNPFRWVVFGMMFSMAMWLSGCAIYDAGIVALHDSVDELKQGATNSPALPPILTPAKPASTDCGCDLNLPLCDPPYSLKWLDEQGNRTECPVPHGMDIRGQTLYPSVNKRCSLHILPQLVSGRQADGTIHGKCAVVEGYGYHFTGYAHNRDKDPVLAKPGEPFKYVTTTMVWHDCRKVK